MTDSPPLTGQVALVTGGTRGIGRAVAAFLLDAGIQVVLTGTNRQAAEETAAQLAGESPTGARAHGAACDVTDDASVAALAAFVRDRCGRLDILINNAGIGIYHPTPELSLEDFRQVVETNLTGVFRVTKALLPLLLEAAAAAENDAPSGATVINIGSLAGRHPFKGGAAYNASKFGLVGLSEAMMLDLREAGVRVATVMPGSVASGFAGRSAEDGTDWKLSPRTWRRRCSGSSCSAARRSPAGSSSARAGRRGSVRPTGASARRAEQPAELIYEALFAAGLLIVFSKLLEGVLRRSA